ncbi:MAG: recombinase RecT [Bacillota bacterium]|nr:recombinase RecT [Bacillota bacterium]
MGGIELVKKELTHGERFTNKVMAEFGSNAGGEIALTNFQKRLAQNYFISIDQALKAAEEKRMKKPEKYRDQLPVTWDNVDMSNLATSVVSAARIGLDPLQENHVNLIPFKNNSLNKYNITFMPGYRGIELKAKKYGLEVPDHVIVELVYSKDKFKSFKKDRNNKYETYEFEVVNDFDRGEIVGGFYYHVYSDNPEKNKLVVMTIKDIEKRKPQYASAEFWGGEKDVYENGKKTGDKETVDGWYEKMCYKTIYRAAFKDITIDSQKIDDDYLKLKQLEQSFTEAEVSAEIGEKANKEAIDVEYENVQDAEIVEDEKQPDPVPESEDNPGQQQIFGATGTEGPGF